MRRSAFNLINRHAADQGLVRADGRSVALPLPGGVRGGSGQLCDPERGDGQSDDCELQRAAGDDDRGICGRGRWAGERDGLVSFRGEWCSLSCIARISTHSTAEHGQGRIPEVTLECMRHLRRRFPAVRISVEVEKPGRAGLPELAADADVVFYSKSWAQVSRPQINPFTENFMLSL